MIKKLVVAVGLTGVVLSAFANGVHPAAFPIEKAVELKDGSTVHIFADGKMAMESQYGRVVRMEEGHVMEAKNGEKIVMKGDEVARLQLSLRPEYRY